jgi:hypothetical protein
MLFMVIERYKNRNAAAIYERYQEKGRMLPDGLLYLSSWVEENYDRCFQLMETEDPKLLDEWITHWNDLVDFEVFPVIDSQTAATRAAELNNATRTQ